MNNPLPSVEEKTKRFAYLDNLRSWVIFLVVACHSMVTYSGFGSWYYKEGMPALLDPISLILFGIYGSFTQAWFMGILFFLAAVFATRSLAKRGPAAFIKERLFRLGVPLLIYALVIDPFINYFLINRGGIPTPANLATAYLNYLTSFGWVGSTGPLWFAEALILFSLAYTLWRIIRPARNTPARQPATLTFILIILATGIAAFSIRLFFPIGTSVANLQLCYFAAYIALFMLGIHAGERKWFDNFGEKQGLRWFIAVLAAGIPAWFVIMVLGGATRGAFLFNGGFYWQSFAFAFWESFVAIGFSLGMVAFFRKFLNFENSCTRLLAANNFGVYTFHAPVLIIISLLLKSWFAPMLLKHVVVAPLAFLATLLISALILRRIPGLRAALK